MWFKLQSNFLSYINLLSPLIEKPSKSSPLHSFSWIHSTLNPTNPSLSTKLTFLLNLTSLNFKETLITTLVNSNKKRGSIFSHFSLYRLTFSLDAYLALKKLTISSKKNIKTEKTKWIKWPALVKPKENNLMSKSKISNINLNK